LNLLKRRKLRKFDRINIDWNQIPYNRISVLNFLIKNSKIDSYLEIGCDKNLTFDSIFLKNKIGVDPVRGGTHRMTSDNFFDENNTIFDLIFIDGLHHYEQVKRDVINSLNKSKSNSWIVLHDVFPRNAVEEHTPCITSGPWTGDVWKIAFDLMKINGIEFKIVLIDFGVLVIRKLQEKVDFNIAQNNQVDRNFDYFYSNRHILPLLEWEDFTRWATRVES
jgi:predicted O-methyltransferase YrrM